MCRNLHLKDSKETKWTKNATELLSDLIILSTWARLWTSAQSSSNNLLSSLQYLEILCTGGYWYPEGLDPDIIKTMYQGDTDLDNRNPRPPEQASATSRAPPPAGPAQSGWWRLISVHFKPLLVIIQHLELRCISTFDIQNQSLNLWYVEPMFVLTATPNLFKMQQR